MPKPMPRKKKYSVDFTGVEGGGRSCPDGRYLGKIKSVEEKEGSESGQPYLLFKWNVNGATVYDNVSLQPQALWRLKNLLSAFGFDGLDGAYDFDPSDVLDQECGVEITNEDYQGKEKPKITDYFGADQVGEPTTGEKASSSGTKPQTSTGASSKIKVGSKVKFDDEDGKTFTGKVTKIEADNATVDVAGDEWDVELENLTLA